MIGVVNPVERCKAIWQEGLKVIQDFAEFKETDIETLYKPSGTIANPNAAEQGH